MKIGTIVCNHWASDDNPIKYFIYTGIKGRYATGIALIEGKLERLNCYASDFKDREVFEPVGYCNAFDIIKEELQAINK